MAHSTPPRSIELNGRLIDVDDIISVSRVPGTGRLELVVRSGARPPDPLLFRVGHLGVNLSLVTAHEWRRREGEPFRLALTLANGTEVEATGTQTVGRVAGSMGIEGPPSLPESAAVADAEERLAVTARGHGDTWILTSEEEEQFRLVVGAIESSGGPPDG